MTENSTAQSPSLTAENTLPPPRDGLQWQDAAIYRNVVIGALVILVMLPVGLIIYQSFLDGAFFYDTSKLGFTAYRFILTDPEFWRALGTTAILSVGMVSVALPLGAILAFLLTRTDIKFRGPLEIMMLAPMFISSLVLAFGYTVAIGPTGILSLFVKNIIGFVPWNIYSIGGIILVTGLSHVPHVYLYTSAAMRNLPTDLEEAARTSGANVVQVLRDVTLPMVLPSIIYAAALNLLLGFELFGVPLVLGDPNGILVLTTYIYKLTTLFGVPTYQLMAVVSVFLVLLTLPLIYVQRRLLRHARRFAALGGKGNRATPLTLGTKGQIIALSAIFLWLFIAVILPIGGIIVRAFVDAWGAGVNIFDHLTLNNFSSLLEIDSLTRGVINTLVIGIVGGAAAVFLYFLIGLAGHRNQGLSGAALDYSVLLPRALPGLVVGLAFFWVFLFVPVMQPLRTTLFSLFVAYTIVGLSYGLRLIQANLLQVSPDLEEAARVAGADTMRTWRDVVMPLTRPGLAGAWALIMIIFMREYATGVYLMTSGTEVIGSLMVSLLQTGAMDTIAALAFLSVFLTAAGLLIALKLGARIND